MKTALAQFPGAEKFVPAKPHPALPELARAAKACRGCDLYKNATQTVFGEGAAHAKIILIGEQPGNDEDLRGHPFIGPAGKLLDKAIAEAGIQKKDVYVTNAVKHFKWTPRGKRRLHAKPSAREQAACLAWLQREIETIHPQVIVCLGATAGAALFGAAFRVGAARGAELKSPIGSARVVATVHPSALLRLPDHSEFDSQFAAFVKDLQRARSFLK